VLLCGEGGGESGVARTDNYNVSHVLSFHPSIARRSTLIGENAVEQVVRTPDSRAHRLEKQRLTVVNEHVHLGAEVLDVPLEDLGLGGLEDDLLDADRVGERRGDV